MVALLKQKAKVGLVHKNRKSYEIKPIFQSNKRAKERESQIPTFSKSKEEEKLNESKAKKIQPKIVEKYDQPMSGNK